MRILLSIVMALLWSVSAMAQMADPVHFKPSINVLNDNQAEIIFSATIDQGWHVYSTELGNDGPTEASFHTITLDGVELDGKLSARGNEINHFDNMFEMQLRYFEKECAFVQPIRFTKDDYNIECYLEYGACNDENCMPPTSVDFKQSGKLSELAVSEPIAEFKQAEEMPVTSDGGEESSSFWKIFLAGMAGGFLALLTPCVWPIIPMTVSFFLKRNKDQKKAIKEALTYGASIVIIYVLLGLLVTLIFGASALNALSTNAVFNIFFCLLLVVFAASFFGAFDIKLPTSWGNKIDDKSAETTGVISIFFMAFTLALVSFSCTGPVIGFLLVAVSTQGDILAPTVGMFGFAVALAIPFTVFAMFPSLLKAAPKSGGWMNTVKVVLGFIELAFALKFLSVADLAYGWHILDREVFLSLWIIIFGLMGIYLLGWLKFPHDDMTVTTEMGEKVSTLGRTNVPQFFLGSLSLAFALYMIPGLWGAPLKAVSAFAPPMFTQDYVVTNASSSSEQKSSVEPQFKDFDEAMVAAKEAGKPLMLDFTGFGCVNCRKMEAAVWTDQRVADIINNKYILVSLYVDDKTPLAEAVVVNENGRETTLRTVGDKWSYLQRSLYKANTQPFYVLIDNEGNQLTDIRSYDEDIAAYIAFLEKGLREYSK